MLLAVEFVVKICPSELQPLRASQPASGPEFSHWASRTVRLAPLFSTQTPRLTADRLKLITNWTLNLLSAIQFVFWPKQLAIRLRRRCCCCSCCCCCCRCSTITINDTVCKRYLKSIQVLICNIRLYECILQAWRDILLPLSNYLVGCKLHSTEVRNRGPWCLIWQPFELGCHWPECNNLDTQI